ncbi:MAG: ribose-5-phosphate isomerase RpiA [Acidobacteriaceae bacterium]|nr:ribose-5-phosphate isomerase RpiA [Acidobacteriaceae bacterium]
MSAPEIATDQWKRIAAQKAAEDVVDGMVVGLGSGTTAAHLVEALGQRVRQGLRIIGVPTSEQTAAHARQLGIPISDLGEHPSIDLTIDGADEVETRTLDLIKGHGGALLREKIVAAASRAMSIVVDETKIVERLGSHFAVPVEVVPFGWQTTAARLRELKGEPQLRLDADGRPFVSDGGHSILDLSFRAPIRSAAELDLALNSVVGVVEHGLFLGFASKVFIGGPNGVKLLTRS